MPAKTIINEQQEKRICERYLKGLNIRDISKELKISQLNISKVLKANKIEVSNTRTKFKITEETERIVIDLYVNKLMPIHKISELLKCRKTKLRTIILKNDYKIGKTGSRTKMIKTLKQEEEIFQKLKQGFTTKEICDTVSFKLTPKVLTAFLLKKFPCKNPSSLREVWLSRYPKEMIDNLYEDRKRTRALKSKFSKGKRGHRYGKKPSQIFYRHSYTGYYKKIFFRSLKEASFMIFLDENKISWQSGEEIGLKIPYIGIDGREKNYWPDFLINNEKIVEIKPLHMQNCDVIEVKSAAARKFCESEGLKFVILDFQARPDLVIKKLETKELVFNRNLEEKFWLSVQKKRKKNCQKITL